MKLDNRTLRLIAVGASITANCQPCLRINVAKALESGADEPEIAAAIQVGKMVRQGAASKMDDFASDLNPATLLVASPATEECGCSA
jgi:AhpD family alkylhydroperoxidase